MRRIATWIAVWAAVGPAGAEPVFLTDVAPDPRPQAWAPPAIEDVDDAMAADDEVGSALPVELGPPAASFAAGPPVVGRVSARFQPQLLALAEPGAAALAGLAFAALAATRFRTRRPSLPASRGCRP